MREERNGEEMREERKTKDEKTREERKTTVKR